MHRPSRIPSLAFGAACAAALTALVRHRIWLRDLRSFEGRVVVISGGTRGLGFALARTLASAGALVTIAGRDRETALRAQDRLAQEGLAVDAVACDVRDPQQAQRLIEHVERASGNVEVLFNVAGVIEVGSVWDQSLDDFRESIETHVFGPLHLMRAVLPAMRARGDGRIANVASVGGLAGVPHLAPYCAGKFGLVGLSQAYSAEVAHDGITVTTICPWLMRTGSPDNASFKGRHRAEYGWFTLSDANPLLSVSTPRAVRTMVRAVARRRPFTTIGVLPRIAQIANAVAPSTTTRLLALAARALPPPLDDESVKRRGEDSHSAVAPSVLTALDRIAKERYNQ